MSSPLREIMKERPIIFNGDEVRAILDGRKTMTRRVKGLECVNENPDAWALVRRMEKVEPCLNDEPQEFPGVDDNSWLALKDVRGIADNGYNVLSCPYGKVGDRLWVREAVSESKVRDHETGQLVHRTWYYRADEEVKGLDGVFVHTALGFDQSKLKSKADLHRWTPAIHMPRWASRLTLEITGVRVERLMDISEEDAKAEGFEPIIFDEFDIAEIMFNDPDCQEAEVLEILGPGQIPAKADFSLLWDEINGKRHPWASNPWVWVIEFKTLCN